jgi:predicted nucleic acid-binding protein
MSHQKVGGESCNKLPYEGFRLRSSKKSGGSPTKTDIWIAAQTMEYGAELVTMDRLLCLRSLIEIIRKVEKICQV